MFFKTNKWICKANDKLVDQFHHIEHRVGGDPRHRVVVPRSEKTGTDIKHEILSKYKQVSKKYKRS
jgi:hypothetical protein